MKIILLIMKVYKKLNKLPLFIPFLLLLACNPNEVQEQVYSGEALGTTYQIKFFHDEELDLDKGLDSLFKDINSSMSTYQSDSDISRINIGDTSVIVDENFQEVFLLSEQIYLESGGYFDPTVGKIVNIYGFGPVAGDESIDPGEIDSLMAYVGYNKLELTEDGRIQKEHPEMFIDFNAIAKGFAVDVIGRYLDQKNVQDYLVEIGGELTAKGVNVIKDQPWVVGIDNPRQTEENRSLQAAVQLENRAMATSGNYRKFKTDLVSGQAFVHTINPLTGLAEKSNLLSASVLAPNCALADGYATAFMAMGFEKSLEMLKRIGEVDVYFIYADGDNEPKVFASEGFEEKLVQN